MTGRQRAGTYRELPVRKFLAAAFRRRSTTWRGMVGGRSSCVSCSLGDDAKAEAETLSGMSSQRQLDAMDDSAAKRATRGSVFGDGWGMVDNEEMMGWQGECRSSVHWLGCRRQKSFCLDSHLFRCAAASVIGTRELNEASKSLRGRCGRAKIHQIPKWQTHSADQAPAKSCAQQVGFIL